MRARVAEPVRWTATRLRAAAKVEAANETASCRLKMTRSASSGRGLSNNAQPRPAVQTGGPLRLLCGSAYLPNVHVRIQLFAMRATNDERSQWNTERTRVPPPFWAIYHFVISHGQHLIPRVRFSFF